MRTYTKFTSYLLAIIIALAFTLQGILPASASSSVFSTPHDAAYSAYYQKSISSATWYVSTIGDDLNDCATSTTPCLTINAAIGKAADDDSINITEGVYGSSDVLINKSVIISGGWDSTFSSKTGPTIIDGRTVKVDDNNSSTTKVVSIDYLTIRNSNDYVQASALVNNENLVISNCEIYNNKFYGGMSSINVLTANNCKIHDNSGAGVQSYGTTTINLSYINNNNESGVIISGGTVTITDSLIYNNKASFGGGGVRILSDSTLTINNSAIYQNATPEGDGGGIDMGGYWSHVNVNNSTINRNTAQNGGGLYGGNSYNNYLALNNVTLSENSAATGGGITGWAKLSNTIVAYNTALSGANCAPLSSVEAAANDIIFKNDCGFTVPVGSDMDYVDIDPQIVSFIPETGYAPLSPSSPAVNSGDPATCFGTADQRGAPRVGICDIGAYEYTIPGTPSTIYAISGSEQRAPLNTTFTKPFLAVLLDANGSPVGPNNPITFSAPTSGPSGTFASSGTNEETVLTSESGFVTSSVFTTDSQSGDYTVTASASGVSNAVIYNVSNGFWAISPDGNDLNNCLSTLTPCASISGVLAKQNFYDGDSIRLLAGSYNTFHVVNLKISATINGGWNSTFASQTGTSILRDVFNIYSSSNATIEKIIIDSSPSYDGISNAGILLFDDGAVRNSGGVSNTGILTIKNSTISGNTASGAYGGGIRNGGSGIGAKVTIINSTITNNSASQGGAIYNSNSYSSTVIEIYNSTITNNTATYWGSGGIEAWGTVILSNTIVVGNYSPPQADTTFSPDCRGTFTSLGHNIIGNVGIGNAGYYPCSTTFDVSDIWGDNSTPIPASSVLLPLTDVGNGIWMHPLPAFSLAIDAGSPLPPGTPNSYACPISDQRGLIRPQGLRCDIGSYEYGTDPGIFFDVPQNHWAWKHIESIYNAGITGGCSLSPLMYCPETNVNRAQMAVFLLRGEHGSAYVPPTVGSGTGFTDVPADYWAAAWIKQLAAEGITSGCGPSHYCPETSVTRDQMAVFLLRSEHGASYTPPPATGVFTDVPTDHWAAAWIEQLAAEGITGGCGADTYCPATIITRDQMAVFLQRTFNSPLP